MKRYFKKNKKELIGWILMSLIETGLSIYFAVYLQEIIDIGNKQNYTGFARGVIKGVLFVIAIIVINYLMTLFYAKFMKKVMVQIRTDIFGNVMRADINQFNQEKSAKYISVLSNDMERIEQDYVRNIPMIFSKVLLLLGAIAVLFWFSPILAIFNIFLSVFTLLVPKITGSKMEDYQKKQSLMSDEYMSEMKEFFQGYEVIKCYGAEKNALNRFRNITDKKEEAMFLLRRLQGVAIAISEGSANVSFICNILLGIYFCMKGYLTIGAVLGVVQLLNYIVYPVNRIVDGYSRYRSVKAVNKRVEELLKDDENNDKIYEEIESVLPIKMENVSFSYEKEKLALHDINLTFEQNKKYVIVGKSGSGKSTLIKLLEKYYDNYQGTIYYDKQIGKNIEKASLFSKIGIIQQNVMVFDDSLENNITMYENYSREQVENAITQCGLQEFVQCLPEGLDTVIQEGGRNISGGEKQRIAIARAFMRKVPVMILDEATSSLDNENAYNIENSVLNKKDITAIVITHRMKAELLKKYDSIIVMDSGHLVEQGTFEELMQKRGYFYSLYSISEYTQENLDNSKLNS